MEGRIIVTEGTKRYTKRSGSEELGVGVCKALSFGAVTVSHAHSYPFVSESLTGATYPGMIKAKLP